MTGNTPTVAVVITYYRDTEFFPEALASVLAQTVRPTEIVVVDDASPEGFRVPEISDPSVRVVCHPTNRGPGAARQTGVEATRAPWIAFLDADDTWLPHKLERQLDAVARDPNADVHHTGLTTVYADGREVEHTRKPRLLSLGTQLRRNQALPSATMMRREALAKVGGWSPDRMLMEDWDLGIRFVAAGHRVAFLPEPLVRFRRQGQGNLSARGFRHVAGNLATIRKHLVCYRRELGWRGTLEVVGRVLHDEGCRRGGAAGLGVRGLGHLVGFRAKPG